MLDNLSTMATFEEENAASAFDPVMKLMMRLRQAGRSVMLIHHARKGKEGEGAYRGTSKMGVVFNSIIALSHPDGIRSRHGTAFDLKWEKLRGRMDATTGELQVHLKEDPERCRHWWEHTDNSKDRLRALVKLVKSRRYPTQAAIGAALAEELGLPSIATGTLSNWKRDALAHDLISRDEWKQCLLDARDAATTLDANPDF